MVEITVSAGTAPGQPLPTALGLEAHAIIGFHDRFLHGEDGERHPAGPAWRWIEENHRCNTSLWKEEDKARRTDVADAEIVQCKRNIDRYNQRRNDAVEALDQEILSSLGTEPGRQAPRDVRLSSETAGAIVDRLSILALKIYHMRLQADRREAGEEHMARCRAKLEILVEQRTDLAACLNRLLCEARSGTARFKTYRQFKMYNDPSLNPELYARQGAAAQAADTPAASPAAAGRTQVDVLIPTCERPGALAVTLTSLFAQTCGPLRIVISDQSEKQQALAAPEVQAMLRLLRAHGHTVDVHRHLPRRGLAEQRHFLLEQARAPYVLFLDDDVVLEPDLVERLLGAMREQGCGFVGSALIGMSHVNDERPHQQAIEFWEGKVEPETVKPDSPAWARHHLHSAANLYHLQKKLGLTPATQRLYRVAWVGGCVMFDTAKLAAAGGFEFWQHLPEHHCGEDVYAQLRVMARDGGCGLIPSGAYHQELPTTVTRRDVDAPRALDLG